MLLYHKYNGYYDIYITNYFLILNDNILFYVLIFNKWYGLNAMVHGLIAKEIPKFMNTDMM